MKSLGLMIVGLAIASMNLTAQEPGGGRRRGGGGRGFGGGGSTIAQLADANKSGDVTQKEWSTFVASVKKGDAGVDSDKLRARIVTSMLDQTEDGKVGQKDLAKIFASMDRDGDKAISTEEMNPRRGGGARGRGRGRGEGQGQGRGRGEGQGRGRGGDRPNREELMKKYDANGNGKLDPEERAKMQEELGGGRGRGEGERGEGGRGQRNRNRGGNRMGAFANPLVIRAADKDGKDGVNAAEWTAFVASVAGTEKGTIDSTKLTKKILAAEKARGEGDDQGGRRRRFTLGRMIDGMMDVNRDETVDLADLESTFKTLDKNGDKALQKEELRPQRRRGGRRGDDGKDA